MFDLFVGFGKVWGLVSLCLILVNCWCVVVSVWFKLLVSLLMMFIFVIFVRSWCIIEIWLFNGVWCYCIFIVFVLFIIMCVCLVIFLLFMSVVLVLFILLMCDGLGVVCFIIKWGR